MIRTTMSNGWIRGFGDLTEVGVAGETSHLLYADDSLVFCEAEVDQIRHLREILSII